VANNENYQSNPDKALEKVLRECEWERVGPGLWQKGKTRFLVDDVGIFVYRLLSGLWVRTAGLSHDLITVGHLRERVLYFQDFEIDL
jgi:hypothetical protein